MAVAAGQITPRARAEVRMGTEAEFVARRTVENDTNLSLFAVLRITAKRTD
jgi:hypothetical protein